MLPRRGYEPVDDGDDDDMNGTTMDSSSSSAGALNDITPTSTTTDGDNAKPTTRDDDNDSSDGEEDGRITVRVLDVRGQFYPLRVHPETTVRELKQNLVNVTGVEFGRQRIIHGGKVRSSSSSNAGGHVVFVFVLCWCRPAPALLFSLCKLQI